MKKYKLNKEVQENRNRNIERDGRRGGRVN